MKTSAPADGPFAALSRRRFLAASLGFAVAAGGGLGGAAWWARGPTERVEGLRVLSAAEYRTLTQIARANFGDAALSLGNTDLARAFDAYLADEPAANVRELRLALKLVELSPIVWGPRRTTFARLSKEERAAYWAEWPTSERLVQRQISLGFRKFLNLVYYDQPGVWAAIGYPGPSFARLGAEPGGP